ncbi:MAG: hypothetical protein KC657_07070 [Myxococcales bacterium]|nr:hypothetical protein [Myxococcales bacterium]
MNVGFRWAALSLALGSAGALLHCGGSVQTAPTADAGTDGPPGGGPDVDAQGPPDVPLVPASKVDLLLVVDNSASMADKSALLASSVGRLIRALAPVGDLHVGVISSSLGSLGGDVCPRTADLDQRAHLLTRGATRQPPDGVLTSAGGVDALVADTEAVVRGVGQSGCGLEAPLEASYRFLVQPDPWESVVVDAGTNRARYEGVDAVLLGQRKAFLRPDSLVIVLTLTDEDESIADPLSVAGQGWAFMSSQFPGSTTFRADGRTTTAPRGTSVCATSPADPACTSCGFAAACNASDPACAAIKADPNCQGGGYFGPDDDSLNVRFHRMKERYGLDPRYPTSRYVDGLTSATVPDGKSEHDAEGKYIGTKSCTNPLFAASLPSQTGDELCKLPRGPRARGLVLFGVITGVPGGLLTAAAKDLLPVPDWTQILGKSPETFDFTGIDPHMIPSTQPRQGLPPPSGTRGDNGTDPVHGREFDTKKDDLQYACTFAIPSPRTCTVNEPGCDCAQPDRNPPLCGATVGEQVRAKAYPSVRPLIVARDLGDRAVVGSICPAPGTTNYDATMDALGAKLAGRVAK